MRQHAFGPGIHIAYDDGKVRCPHCHTKHSEPGNDQWLRRIEKGKRGYLRKRCSCGKVFGIAISMVDGMIGFTLRPRRYWNKRSNQKWTAWARTTGYYRLHKALQPWQTTRIA